MDVYALYPDCKDEYRALAMTVGRLDEFLWRFDGTPMKKPWTDVTIGWDPETSRAPEEDYPCLMLSLPVFSASAIEALEDLLDGSGEILPATCEGEQIFLFNVTNVIDALDESNSEVIRFDDCARLMRVDRYAFLSDKLKGSVIFKIPQFPTERVFVTNHFVERVKATLLKGFWFPRVWSTDEGATIDWVW